MFVAGEKGSFLKVFDMYMEKLVVGFGVKGCIDFNLLFKDNLNYVVKVFGKFLIDLVVIMFVKLCYD